MANLAPSHLLSLAKNLMVPAGRSPRRVRSGLYKDVVLDLDLRSQTQMVLGLWERETYAFVQTAGANAQWLLDIGAGSGEMTLYFLRQPNLIRAIAVEPDSAEVDALRRHLKLNGFSEDSCQIVNGRIGSGEGMVPLADLVRPLQGRGFIKIDVDGAEMEVLKSAGNLLDEGSVAILIETHSDQLEADCMAWLLKRNYKTSIIKNAWWRRILPDGRVIAHNRWLAAIR
jgi:precorrin-6B methylase 2